MKKSQIILSKFSPLKAVDAVLHGSDDETIETPRVCSLYRCGESKAKPLCDGTHATVGFDGTREDSEKDELEHYQGKDITIVFDCYLCMGQATMVSWRLYLAPMTIPNMNRMPVQLTI